MNLGSLIHRLIELCIENRLISSLDEIYIRNRLLSLYKEDNYKSDKKLSLNLYENLDKLLEIAVNNHIISNLTYEKDIFSSKIMNCFLDKPSIINNEFYKLYNTSPMMATEYFYNLSKNSNYIRMDRINKNIFFKVLSNYGAIDITINLSKPEKDPSEIALGRNKISSHYPGCLLCIENEGFDGNINAPDRSNHRLIEVELNKKKWKLQYSPYMYYDEHCILLSNSHEPMSLTKDTFKNLLYFVDKFPHYFLGSNADLPIVGGSILSHEHYQGGHYIFPINNAKELFRFKIKSFTNIDIAALRWPLSTLRLKGADIDNLVECSNYILENWKTYSDKARNILCNTKEISHNTITPICRKEDNLFVMDLVLRNNRTTKEFPLGIFHPHEDVQHIKKENIGLIEVMGLAILPGRLLKELEDIKSFILTEKNSVKAYHKFWALDLKVRYNSKLDIDKFINDELGKKFVNVLECSGVFKQDEKGIAGFKKFSDYLNKI